MTLCHNLPEIVLAVCFGLSYLVLAAAIAGITTRKDK